MCIKYALKAGLQVNQKNQMLKKVKNLQQREKRKDPKPETPVNLLGVVKMQIGSL
jgi:hypothetical protein